MLVYIIHNQQNNQIVLTYETLIEHSPKLQYTHSKLRAVTVLNS